MNITWTETLPDSNGNITWLAFYPPFYAEIIQQDGVFTLFFGNTAVGHSANLGDFAILEAAQNAAQKNFDAN